jgi:CheY-like chemotaxis protein
MIPFAERAWKQIAAHILSPEDWTSMDPKKTILIVDDDQAIRDVLSEYLLELGYEVLTAEDGLDGMDKIRLQNYDLLLLDIRVPYVSGLGLLHIARELDSQIPIVCMTGYGSSPEKVASEEEVQCVLSKPFELKELAQAIERLVHKH